jgi:hypothetical protein
MAPLSSRLFKLKVGYRLGTIRPRTMSLELLAEQMQEEEENEGLGKRGFLSMSHSQKFLGICVHFASWALSLKHLRSSY